MWIWKMRPILIGNINIYPNERAADSILNGMPHVIDFACNYSANLRAPFESD